MAVSSDNTPFISAAHGSKMLHGTLIGILALAATFGVADSWAQADPAWLRGWNEAQEQMPTSVSSKGRIAAEDELGVPMVIQGHVTVPDGRAAGGVLVFAYHRDQFGFELGANDRELTTWRLRGWARTDDQGRFTFQTIRPEPDYLGREAAHVHFTLESADHGRQWVHKIFFADDPQVPESERQRSNKAGDFGWVREIRLENGVQTVDVKFRLKEEADF